MAPDMRPVWSGAFLCGPAVTCLGADWRIRSMAADLAEPGDVMVLTAGGLTERACFGDMTATCWKSKGIEGVVIDGAARDVARCAVLPSRYSPAASPPATSITRLASTTAR